MAPAEAAAHTVADEGSGLDVTVAFSPRANKIDEVVLRLDAGATVADAVDRSRLAGRHPGVALDALPCGVWGQVCSRDTVLRHNDRIELYRPLQVDPMQARRKRHSLQRGKPGTRR